MARRRPTGRGAVGGASEAGAGWRVRSPARRAWNAAGAVGKGGTWICADRPWRSLPPRAPRDVLSAAAAEPGIRHVPAMKYDVNQLKSVAVTEDPGSAGAGRSGRAAAEQTHAGVCGVAVEPFGRHVDGVERGQLQVGR